MKSTRFGVPLWFADALWSGPRRHRVQAPPAPERQPHQYRPDIDGLRAFAVLTVWAFHLNRAWMPGGFIGVDVFFVVSGYVVSLSLAALDGQALLQALGTFYARRMKRLLPALLVCIGGVSLALGAFMCPFPDETNNAIYRTGMAALVGLANLYLIRTKQGYFDGDAVPNAFSHTWSLGVEEQFYLAYPVLMLACRIAGDDKRVDRLRLAVVLVLSLASFGLSAHWSSSNATVAYYMMPGRFWELGVGCALAYAERLGYLARFTAYTKVPRGLPLGALALVLIAAWVTPETGFPFPWALPAVLGTAMLLVAGAHAKTGVMRMLRAPSVVYVGKLSYSLYLWHWPVICLMARTQGLDTPWSIAAAFALTLGLAMASYHGVETPVRHATLSAPRWVFAAALTAVLGTGLSLEAVRSTRYTLFMGSTQDWTADWNPHVDLLFTQARLKARDCHLTAGSVPPAGLDAGCFMHATAPITRRLFLIGDSHAFAAWSMAKAGVDAGLYHLYALSHDACGIDRAQHDGQDSCTRYWRHIEALLSSHAQSGDLVLLVTNIRGSLTAKTTRQDLTQDLTHGLRRLAHITDEKRATLIVQAPLPLLDELAVDCLPAWFRRVPARCLKVRATDLQQREPAIRLLQEVAASTSAVAIWDPYTLLCPEAQCSHFFQGKPLFRDDDHLAPYGGRYLGPFFGRWLYERGLLASP